MENDLHGPISLNNPFIFMKRKAHEQYGICDGKPQQCFFLSDPTLMSEVGGWRIKVKEINW